MEELTCCDCGETWQREIKSGSKRVRCPVCRAALRVRSKATKRESRPFTTGMKKEARKCVVCSSRFVPNTQAQITCPASEQERARRKDPSKAQSWCARRLYRFELGEVDQLQAERLPSFRCVTCNRQCLPGENGVHLTARKFCQRRECKSRYFSQLRRHGLSPDHWFVKAGASCSMADRPTTRRFISTQCIECGTFFLRLESSHRSKYCCKRCKRKPANRTRRARLRASWVETVHMHKIAERDRFTCGICGEPVDMSLGCNDDFAGSIDHVVPLVFGGAHCYSNAQFAHRICNSAKGALEGGIATTWMSSQPQECCRWVSEGLRSWLSNPDSLAGILRGVGGNPG